MPHRTCRHPRRGAFTLVEILIVVVILGILAAIVVPQFSSAAQESRQSSMEQSIHRIRQQVEVYAAQHGGEYPTDASTFEAQMTEPTNAAGQAPGANEQVFGPYIRDIPRNPFTGGITVGEGEPGESDWYYAQGEFRANDSAAHALY